MLELSKFKKIHFDTLDSTNLRARELAGKEPFAIITAGEQTAGKGSKAGKSWFSPKGNLFFTMLAADPTLTGERLPRLAAISALSVVEAVQKFSPNAPLLIKWPNDILLNMKKVCGILIEQEGGSAIIGIGVNVAIAPPAGVAVYPTASLGSCCTCPELADALAEKLVENINSGFDGVLARARKYLFKLGEKVVLDAHGRRVEGVFERLGEGGEIIVDGRAFISGELTKENF